MTMFSFAPATREQAKARIGLQGPAGSGKTMSALKIAERLADGGQIGLVDTERGSALTYAPVPGRPDLGGIPFLHMPMDNYDPRNLIEACRAAAAAALPVLIVDSWSLFYNGKGGLLQIVDQAGNVPGSGGTFGGWRTGTPIEQNMLEALLNYPGHVICTMRTKGDYSIEGKKVTKLGIKPIQREGAEYELGLIIDMVEGTGTVTKTRYPPLEGMTVHHPGAELAEVILDQLGQGVDPIEAFLEELRADGLTYEGALEIHRRADRRGLLALPAAHPTSGEVMPLGEAIRAVGVGLRPTAPPSVEAPSDADLHAALGSPHDDVVADADRVMQDRLRSDNPEPSPTKEQGSSAVSAPQMRRIFALLKAVGCPEERDRRLHAVSLLLGRQVSSMNELATSDGSELIEILSGFENQGPEAFRDLLNELHAKATAAA